MAKKKVKPERLILTRWHSGNGDTLEVVDQNFRDEIQDITDQFYDGSVEPDTYEVIEVEVVRRALVTGSVGVTVKEETK